MKRPATLQKGDTLAIMAPAGIIKNQEAIHQLPHESFRVVRNLMDKWHFKLIRD